MYKTTRRRKPEATYNQTKAGIPVATARLWLGPNTLLRKAWLYVQGKNTFRT
jgi:hypothetical protein